MITAINQATIMISEHKNYDINHACSGKSLFTDHFRGMLIQAMAAPREVNQTSDNI